MGRTYIVEENVGQYLLNIDLQGKAFASGLLIGQVCIFYCAFIGETNYLFIQSKDMLFNDKLKVRGWRDGM